MGSPPPPAQGDSLLLPSGKVKGSGVSPSWGRLLFPLSPAARFQSPSGMVCGPSRPRREPGSSLPVPLETLCL